MAPEYAMGGIFSTRSDIFSFGILVLEILTARPVYSMLGQMEEDILTYVRFTELDFFISTIF
jgi:serine/threonine protein kinase